MKKIKVENMDVWNVEDLMEEFLLEKDDFKFENGVYEIRNGCRGEIDDIIKCDIVDGEFEVKEEEDIKNDILENVLEEEWIFNEMSEEEYKKELCEFVWSGMEGGNCIFKSLYLECWFEESSSCFVRVNV